MRSESRSSRQYAGRRRRALLLVATLALFAATAPATGATFTVTKTTDSADGACNADCSLREAVSAANVDATADEIVLPAGTYRLTIFGASEDANATGDLDIAGDLTISGAGPGTTTILNALGGDRVLDVVAATAVTVTGVTVSGGSPPLDEGGGGIRDATPAALTLRNTVVRGNVVRGTAVGFGGGIYKSGGRLTVTESAVVGNASISNGYGGGIFLNSSDTVAEFTNVTIADNWSNQSGGGVFSNNAITVNLLHVTVVGNHSALGTGGLGGDTSAFRLRSSVLVGNTGGAKTNCDTGAPASDGGNVGDPTCGITLPTDAPTFSPGLEPLTFSAAMPVMVPAVGSPALDRAIGSCPATDALGTTRPQGSGCDAGAVERTVPVTPVVQATPPHAGGLPRVLGVAKAKRVLTCRRPTFTGATGFQVRWLRNARVIRGATRVKRRVVTADVGRVISCRVIATGPGGRTSLVSLGRIVSR
ncbi:MAG: CSLREA domain-containing protein [Thermoleophilia bacterium]|nr:CSLREA domain-containing protein [Thermoleophilia bacterium]